MARVSGNPKMAANWVMGDLMGAAQGRGQGDRRIAGQRRSTWANWCKLIAAGQLSGKLAKEIFPKMFSTGDAPAAIMEREGLKQISDSGALEKVIAEVIAANPKQVEQYRGGKTTVINFLVGQAMKATRGQANVALVTELFKQKLG